MPGRALPRRAQCQRHEWWCPPHLQSAGHVHVHRRVLRVVGHGDRGCHVGLLLHSGLRGQSAADGPVALYANLVARVLREREDAGLDVLRLVGASLQGWPLTGDTSITVEGTRQGPSNKGE